MLEQKDYIAVVQCDIVQEVCSGYQCERAFHERTGGFVDFPKEKDFRALYLTCSGCCGRALQRKLLNLVRNLEKQEKIKPERVIVQFSSCITKDSFHGPPCPHLDYLKELVVRMGLDFAEDTAISQTAEERRATGCWVAPQGGLKPITKQKAAKSPKKARS